MAARVLESRDDRLKLLATATLLRARRQERDIFTCGGYNPVDVQGSRRDHVFAFTRHLGDRRVIVAVPRLVASLTQDEAPVGERVWQDTHLLPPPEGWGRAVHDAMTDRCGPTQADTGAIRLADAFAHFPLAVLVGGQVTS